jgi:transcriptional regulator with XRE-family HTH domain
MSEMDMSPIERRKLGCARAQHAIFDAVYALWEEREAEGLTQQELADFLDRNPSWVSRTLSGPGNWTLRTFGELVEALGGYIDVTVRAREKLQPGNYDIYSELLDDAKQTFCPLTDYRPQLQNRFGTVTFTVAPTTPSGNSAPGSFIGTVGAGLKRVAA